MMRALAALALAVFGAAATAQEVLAPPAGTEFTMKCGNSESRWVVAQNAGGKLRVNRAGDEAIYRQGPVWGYMLGDIYDELGLGAGGGMNRMTLMRGPADGVKLVPGSKARLTYRWVSPRNEADRSHVITVGTAKRVKTAAFGEQEVFEVTDDITSSFHELRRVVQYAPALRMFVSFSVRNNRTQFEQNCVLASLKSP